MSDPEFLPPAKQFSNNWADWADFLKGQHQIFTSDILQGGLTFKEKKICVNFTIDDGYEETFWHITTRNKFGDGSRDPDPARAALVHWIKPVIVNFEKEGIRYWSYLEGSSGKVRHYFQVLSRNYLVILEEKKKSHFLITAYVVDEAYMLKDLNNKFDNRLSD